MVRIAKLCVLAAGIVAVGYLFLHPTWIEVYNDEKGFMQHQDRGSSWIWEKPERDPAKDSLGVDVFYRERNGSIAKVALPAAVIYFLLSRLQQRSGSARPGSAARGGESGAG